MIIGQRLSSPLPPPGFVSFGAYSDPNSAKEPKSKRIGPNLGKMAQIWHRKPQIWPKVYKGPNCIHLLIQDVELL